MFFELVGTIMAGIAAALFVYALRVWKPDLIPRWLLPIAAGGAMLAAAISSEYGWYGRVAGQLPETFVVAQTYDERAALRPWTFLVSYTSRFVAVDRSSTRTNPQVPDQRMVDLYFFGRWAPVQKLTVLWDCAGHRTAALGADAAFDATGEVANADWQPIPPDDPVLRAACAEA
jgi:hypothetical protein